MMVPEERNKFAKVLHLLALDSRSLAKKTEKEVEAEQKDGDDDDDDDDNDNNAPADDTTKFAALLQSEGGQVALLSARIVSCLMEFSAGDSPQLEEGADMLQAWRQRLGWDKESMSGRQTGGQTGAGGGAGDVQMDADDSADKKTKDTTEEEKRKRASHAKLLLLASCRNRIIKKATTTTFAQFPSQAWRAYRQEEEKKIQEKQKGKGKRQKTAQHQRSTPSTSKILQWFNSEHKLTPTGSETLRVSMRTLWTRSALLLEMGEHWYGVIPSLLPASVTKTQTATMTPVTGDGGSTDGSPAVRAVRMERPAERLEWTKKTEEDQAQTAGPSLDALILEINEHVQHLEALQARVSSSPGDELKREVQAWLDQSRIMARKAATYQHLDAVYGKINRIILKHQDTARKMIRPPSKPREQKPTPSPAVAPAVAAAVAAAVVGGGGGGGGGVGGDVPAADDKHKLQMDLYARVIAPLFDEMRKAVWRAEAESDKHPYVQGKVKRKHNVVADCVFRLLFPRAAKQNSGIFTNFRCDASHYILTLRRKEDSAKDGRIRRKKGLLHAMMKRKMGLLQLLEALPQDEDHPRSRVSRTRAMIGKQQFLDLLAKLPPNEVEELSSVPIVSTDWGDVSHMVFCVSFLRIEHNRITGVDSRFKTVSHESYGQATQWHKHRRERQEYAATCGHPFKTMLDARAAAAAAAATSSSSSTATHPAPAVAAAAPLSSSSTNIVCPKPSSASSSSSSSTASVVVAPTASSSSARREHAGTTASFSASSSSSSSTTGAATFAVGGTSSVFLTSGACCLSDASSAMRAAAVSSTTFGGPIGALGVSSSSSRSAPAASTVFSPASSIAPAAFSLFPFFPAPSSSNGVPPAASSSATPTIDASVPHLPPTQSAPAPTTPARPASSSSTMPHPAPSTSNAAAAAARERVHEARHCRSAASARQYTNQKQDQFLDRLVQELDDMIDDEYARRRTANHNLPLQRCDALMLIGDGKWRPRKKTSIPCPREVYRKYFARRFLCIKCDEFRTSQRCPNCLSVLKMLNYNPSNRNSRKGRYRQCPSCKVRGRGKGKGRGDIFNDLG